MPTNPSLMDDEEEHKSLRPYRGKKADADNQNILLKRGEIFIEYPNGGPGSGIGRMKMGDGTSRYTALPYLFDQTDLSDSFIKTVGSAGSTVDNTLLAKLSSTNTKLKDIIAAEKQLFQNRINNEGSQSQAISDLQAATATLNTSVTNNKTAISNLQAATATLNTSVSNNKNAISNLQAATATLSTSVTNNKNAISNLQAATATLNTSVTNNKTAISNLQAATATLNTSVSNNKNAISNLQAATATLNTSVSNNKTAISNLQAATATLNTSVSNNKTAISNLQAATATLNTSMTTANSNISTLWSTVFNSTGTNGLSNAKLRDDINNATGSGTAVAARVATLESTVFNNVGNNSRPLSFDNGTTTSYKANKSLREDINTLWNTVFNNGNLDAPEGETVKEQGNRILRQSINNLNNTVFDNTAFSAGGKANSTLWGEIYNNVEATVFRSTAGATSSRYANTALRGDIGTLWSTVFQDTGNLANAKLRDDISGLQTNVNTITGTTIPNINTSISTLDTHITTVYNKTCEYCSYSWEDTSQSQQFIQGTNQNLYELTCWFGSSSGESVPKSKFGDYLIFYSFCIDNAGSANFSSGHTIKGLIASYSHTPAVMRFDTPVSSDDISWRSKMYDSTTGVAHITVGNSSLQTHKTSFKLSFTQNLNFSTTSDKVTITIHFYAVRINPMTGYM